MNANKFFDSPIARTKVTSAKVKSKELFIGYFVGPFLALLSNAIFGAYLNRYYSDVIGWTDTSRFGIFSTIIPLTSVIFVVLGNLLVGRLIDRTRTTQGKARPYLLISAPLLVIAIAFLFLTPTSLSPMVQMIWIGLSYNLYYAVAFPFFYTAHSSMVGLSTRNSNDRGKLATFSNASGVAAIGIGGSILVPIFLQGFLFVSHNGVIDRAASYNNWRIMMIALCIITFFAILLEYFYTRERITEETVKLSITEEKISVKKQIKGCISSPYWWLIISYFLLFQFGGMVKNGSMSFYARWMFDSVTDEASAGFAMGTLGLIGGIPTAIGMLLAWPIAHKLGKRNAVLYGMIIAVIGGLVSFIDVNNLYVVSAGLILKGIGSIPAMYVTLAILSDVLDHLEAKNGFRSDGFTMSVYGSIMVGLMGLGSGFINALLTASGYNPLATVQSETVEGVLAFAFLGFELICYAVIVILMLFLNVEKHIEEDQKKIVEFQKERVLSSGGEWIDPEERLRLEEEEAEKEAELLKEKKKTSKSKKK